jgi:phosphonatase-like hydrolase
MDSVMRAAMTETPTLELVVFDLGGTTIADHDAVARCLVAALESVKIMISWRQANAVMGLPKPIAIARLIARHDPTVDDPARVVGATAYFEKMILKHYDTADAVIPIEGAAQTFRALRERGAKLAVETSLSTDAAEIILDRLGWLASGLIDARVASDEVLDGRPAPDLLHEAMRLCDVSDVHAVAKVGDTPADLAEGEAARCGWNIGVTYGTHSREQLAEYPHTALIDHLRELPDVLALEPPRTATRFIAAARWLRSLAR